jgi:hypothetical protein
MAPFGDRALAKTVDKMLFPSNDASGSITSTEYDSQRLGWSKAFQQPSVKSSIAASPKGITVAVGPWDSRARNSLAISWTHLTDDAMQAAGDKATSHGININDLAIEGSTGSTEVTDYHHNNVISPNPDAFIKTVTGHRDFEEAAAMTLQREVDVDLEVEVEVEVAEEVHRAPGPLPVFGAMAAFGWASQIRKRIRLSLPNLPAMA